MRACVSALLIVCVPFVAPAQANAQATAQTTAQATAQTTGQTAAPATAVPTTAQISLPVLPAAAYILVDHDTGRVLAAHNERAPLPPASITKLITALTVTSRLKPDAWVTVKSAYPESMPALKISLKQGETWSEGDLMRALLMISANDAAAALAEEVSGTVPEFVNARMQVAQDLGLEDSPVLNDPAGLDDSTFSNDGGDRVSARDMAIVARAAINDPQIRQIVSQTRYDFTGPDRQPHHMLNHNGMLKTYPGAIGLKTGYTQKAGKTLVAAATRNGRTMVAVVLKSDNPNAVASQLMDSGFATPVEAEPTTDTLTLNSVKPYQANPVPPRVAAASPVFSFTATNIALLAFALVVLVVAIRRRQVVVRRRRAAAMRKITLT